MNAAPLSIEKLAPLVETLPASPRLLAELAPLLQQVHIPVGEITELLRRDTSVTARLISMANSAVYARAEPATSLEDAVACIGYREVFRLVGALATTHLADAPLRLYGITTHRFRENALFVALVMEELAEAAGGEPRSAYTVGLLRSIGKVVLDRYGSSRPVTPWPVSADTALLDWEVSGWGCTNAEVAAGILAGWRFPDQTVTAVRDHYAPRAEDIATSHCLNLAAGAADLRGFGLPGEAGYWLFTQENFARSGIDEGKLVWAGERAHRTLSRIIAALG